ncbi:RraA family protein [Pelagibacterium halotolerans]|uniref:RraA family protein n=1 Tax=Pelagibacterium halotolerans TaxID=531813 RepID=UPI00384FDE71
MPDPADPALLSALEAIETATIGHMRYTGFMDRCIQAVDPGQKTRAGVAVTVAIPAVCSTLVHYAVSHIRPGDMLVIDRLGDDRHACVGGAVARAAKQAGAVGIVVDGPVTDAAEILAEGLPVWCRGTSAITTRQAGLGGTFNRPIACGNVPVLPGDMVLADASGVVVLPRDEADGIAEIAIAREGRVARTMDRLSAGEKLGEITGAVRRVEDDLAQNGEGA